MLSNDIFGTVHAGLLMTSSIRWYIDFASFHF